MAIIQVMWVKSGQSYILFIIGSLSTPLLYVLFLFFYMNHWMKPFFANDLSNL